MRKARGAGKSPGLTGEEARAAEAEHRPADNPYRACRAYRAYLIDSPGRQASSFASRASRSAISSFCRSIVFRCF